MQAMRLPESKIFVAPSINIVEKIERKSIQSAIELTSSVDVSEAFSDLASTNEKLSVFSDASREIEIRLKPNEHEKTDLPFASMSSIGVDNINEAKIDQNNSSGSNRSVINWLESSPVMKAVPAGPVDTLKQATGVKCGSEPYIPMKLIKSRIDSIKVSLI